MVSLSVNVNKVATLRNARGGDFPSVADAVRVCLEAGVGGITVHPRHDERHITRRDVLDIAELMRGRGQGEGSAEYNIEGDPRPDWLELVHAVRPQQATLVPVRPGELTSEAGWRRDTDAVWMRRTIAELRAGGIRVSVFVDAELDAIGWAHEMGADRVELYTEPFARAFERGPAAGRRAFERFASAARHAGALGLGVNAGHDLALDNLLLFRELPHLDEVSIGHALIGRAVFVGLERVVGEYLAVLAGS